MSGRGRSTIDPKGGQPYAAAAMSLVFHSAHPFVPTLRADVRLFQVRCDEVQRFPCHASLLFIGRERATVLRFNAIIGAGVAIMLPMHWSRRLKHKVELHCEHCTHSSAPCHTCTFSHALCSFKSHEPTLNAAPCPQVAGQSWFGGGCDLTPFYLNEQDAREFHAFWRDRCAPYGPNVYPEFKAWCDRCVLPRSGGVH